MFNTQYFDQQYARCHLSLWIQNPTNASQIPACLPLQQSFNSYQSNPSVNPCFLRFCFFNAPFQIIARKNPREKNDVKPPLLKAQRHKVFTHKVTIDRSYKKHDTTRRRKLCNRRHIQKFTVGYTPVALELILSFRCFMSLVSTTFDFFLS